MILPAQTGPDLLASLFGASPPPIFPFASSSPAKPDSPFLQLLAALAPPLHGAQSDAPSAPESASVIPVDQPDDSESDSVIWLQLPLTPADGLTILPSVPATFEALPIAKKLDWFQPLPLGSQPVERHRVNFSPKNEPQLQVAPDLESLVTPHIERDGVPLESPSPKPNVVAALPRELLSQSSPPVMQGDIKPVIEPSKPAGSASSSPTPPASQRSRHSVEALVAPTVDVRVIGRVAPPEMKRERPTAIVVDRFESTPSMPLPASSFATNAPAIDRAVEHPQAPPVVSWPEAVEHVAAEAPGELRQTGRAEFHFRVSPPDLGPVRIRLTVQAHEVTAELTVGSDAVRDVVAARLPELRQRLESAGVSVGNFSVTQDGNPRGDSRRAPAEERREAPRSSGMKPVTPRWPSVRLGVIDVTV